MEEWNISNVRSVLESGKLRNIVPEQANLNFDKSPVSAAKQNGKRGLEI